MAMKWILLLLVLVAECKGGFVIKKTTTEIARKANFHIEFDETNLICKVNRKFVSVAFSAGRLNKTDPGYDPSNKKLRKLLRALSPAYVRIGGTRANFLEFEPRSEKNESEDEKNSEEETRLISPLPKQGSSRLESRAIVPQPSLDDVNRLETHKYKRFTLDEPQMPRKDKKSKGRGGEKKPDTDPYDYPQKPGLDVPQTAGELNGNQGEMEEQEDMDRKNRKSKHREKKEKKFKGYKDYKLTADQFDALYHLINGTGNTMLFDINAFPRVENSRSWDSKNAEKLIKYAELMGYTVDWQLGNEPNHYKKFGKEREQTGEEVGNDYISFKSLVKSNMPQAKIVGPDVTRPKKGGKVEEWLGEFLKTAGDSIDALTWHQYYVDGKEASEDDFVDANILDKFDEQSKLMKGIAAKHNFSKPIWITETGSAWGGGAPNLSNRFAGMFPYVDKLGVAAQHCMHVVARQAFLAGKYAMVNKTNYNPHPEYFAAALFKRLSANGVLSIRTDKKDKNFRVYARCARPSKHTLPGSVFIYILNLSENSKTFAFPVYELFKVKQYLFTSVSLQSDVVLLNGKPLEMDGDKLPRMRPVEVEQPVKIPGRSIGYYILDLVSLNIC